MKILYSAYECNPAIGSDAYVGWSWAKQMSRENEVHILTNEGNKRDIELYLRNQNDQAAFFHYIPLPSGFKKIFKGRKGYFASYVVWQWFAYKYAQKLNKRMHFDIVHHITIADFRILGFLWKINVPFVIGPVGGGQETPVQLNYYIRDFKKNEKIRSVINDFAAMLPLYRKAALNAARIFVSNDETIQKMTQHIGNNIKLYRMCELGIDRDYLEMRSGLVHQKGARVHILFAGRMMYRKGVELLLDAISVVDTKNDYIIDMCGAGHQIETVKKQIREKKLQDRVILHGKIPFNEMPTIYANSDIFVLPSLRETTGTAVIEAMANKLPIVALNQNGVKYLVKDDAGILVDIFNREQIIKDFAAALKLLIENDDLRVRLGNNGFRRLESEYTWEVKCKEMMEIYTSVVHDTK